MAKPPPGTTQAQLPSYLRDRLAPSRSTVRAIHRETTVCYAYMCPYAYACDQKTARQAKVLLRRCMRYMPEGLRAQPAVSDMALDLVAARRDAGGRVSTEGKALLDRVRPDGPLRSLRSR
jgi:hypothetical protein